MRKITAICFATLVVFVGPRVRAEARSSAADASVLSSIPTEAFELPPVKTVGDVYVCNPNVPLERQVRVEVYYFPTEFIIKYSCPQTEGVAYFNSAMNRGDYWTNCCDPLFQQVFRERLTFDVARLAPFTYFSDIGNDLKALSPTTELSTAKTDDWTTLTIRTPVSQALKSAEILEIGFHHRTLRELLYRSEFQAYHSPDGNISFPGGVVDTMDITVLEATTVAGKELPCHFELTLPQAVRVAKNQKVRQAQLVSHRIREISLLDSSVTAKSLIPELTRGLPHKICPFTRRQPGSYYWQLPKHSVMVLGAAALLIGFWAITRRTQTTSRKR